jgi:hypothetical protein
MRIGIKTCGPKPASHEIGRIRQIEGLAARSYLLTVIRRARRLDRN